MGKKHFAIFANEAEFDEQKVSVLESPYVAMMSDTGDLKYQKDAQRIIIMTSDSNPLTMAVCYNKGIAASPDKMTLAEALAVTELEGIFAGTNIETFDEFKYFTNVKALTGAFNGAGAFQNCTALKSITLPNGLERLNGGFYNCGALTELVIPDSVKTISGSAFANCGLKKLHIGKSVANFELRGIANIQDVKVFDELTLDANNTSFFMKDGVLYNNARTSIICSERGHTIIDIVEGITIFERVNLSAVEELTLPSTITSCEDYGNYSYTSNMIKFTVKATTPPTLTQYVFRDHKGILYVPAESVDAYEANTYWGMWNSIQPISE